MEECFLSFSMHSTVKPSLSLMNAFLRKLGKIFSATGEYLIVYPDVYFSLSAIDVFSLAV
jgi:hypothetical protein